MPATKTKSDPTPLIFDDTKNASAFGPDAEAGVYLGVPEQEYHDHPALSRSILAEAAQKSPAHALYEWHSDEEESSDAASLGTALHSRVLEPESFDARYDVAADQCEATKGDGDRCTYSAKQRHDGDWFCGTHAPNDEPDDIEVLKADDYEAVQGMTSALHEGPDTSPLLFGMDGASEVTILFDDPVSGIRCKARPDRVVPLSDGSVTIVDLKSTRSAHPDDFKRKISSYGYWLQPPFYTLALEQAGVEVRDFVFAVVESSAPYATACYRPSETIQTVARTRCGELIEKIADAKKIGYAKSYTDGVEEIGMKRYAKRRLGLS